MPLINLIRAFIRELTSKRYFAILACTVCLTVVAPLIKHSFWSHALFFFLVAVCFITISFKITERGTGRAWVLGLASLSGLMWVLSTYVKVPPFNGIAFELVASAVCFLFFAHACYVMLQDILSGATTSNRIYGVVCVYILIGFCFAILHCMVGLNDPSSYSIFSHLSRTDMRAVPLAERYPPFVYFSFCALTTLGYGDILPLSRLARTLSWLEAVVGQFYMAVLVARLVGLHIASASAPHSPRSSEDERALLTLERSLATESSQPQNAQELVGAKGNSKR